MKSVEMGTDYQYDVIIVGGRPAGASLAARLGAQGMRVLVLERTTFPSKRGVISTPFLLGSGMALLDEIGADEEIYAEGTPRIERFVLEFKDYFRTFGRIATVGERDYMYTIDRERFDHHLWRNLKKWPNIERRAGWSVVDLVRDEGGRVCGVVARQAKEAAVEFRAKLVVGADGRFSVVARKAGAKVKEERTDISTTIYYTTWQNVSDYDESGEAVAHIHTLGNGYSFVFMPTADGMVNVVFQCPADMYEQLEGDVEQVYREALRSAPYVWRRLAEAQEIAPLQGMKRVGNLYREAGGDGWVLVGDALHQKDSIDAQGIYDALLEAKLLSEAIGDWCQGEKTWAEGVKWYEERVWAETYPMFESTLERVKREIYSVPPPFIIKTVLRWVLTNPEYMRRFSLLLTRQYDPVNWAPPAFMLKAIGEGIVADVKRLLQGKDDPFKMPNLS
ncbi:MAG TPA: NAD(P)/FAD-dependent oxidoreductase [Anaerolineae bacterium]|nr:NAD(P)/FAD-dependent oxidoreductase [Anaerolineae bacterium]